jgi:hypothetical protein
LLFRRVLQPLPEVLKGDRVLFKSSHNRVSLPCDVFDVRLVFFFCSPVSFTHSHQRQWWDFQPAIIPAPDR